MRKLLAALAAIPAVILAALGFIGLMVLVASAAETVTTVPTPSPTIVSGRPIYDAFINYAWPVIAGAIATWAAAIFHKKTNIELSAKNAAIFQTALTNAGAWLAHRLGDKLGSLQLDVHNPFIREAIDMVVDGSADAIKSFGLKPGMPNTDEIIGQRVIAKAQLAKASNPAAIIGDLLKGVTPIANMSR